MLLSLKGKVLVSIETDDSKNCLWLIFKNGKGTIKQGNWPETAESCVLRKSNFEGPQSQFHNFFFRNSAIHLVVRNIAQLQRCGLKLRTPNILMLQILSHFGLLLTCNV
jgi:hypothetical protein